ncbi:MAG: hypothetical protein RH859_09400, partial [Longimicrobiales bacterium]
SEQAPIGGQHDAERGQGHHDQHILAALNRSNRSPNDISVSFFSDLLDAVPPPAPPSISSASSPSDIDPVTVNRSGGRHPAPTETLTGDVPACDVELADITRDIDQRIQDLHHWLSESNHGRLSRGDLFDVRRDLAKALAGLKVLVDLPLPPTEKRDRGFGP